MAKLRKMTLSDIPLFSSWLDKSHVSPWFNRESWMDEIEKMDSEYKWIEHFILEDDSHPIGFCQYYPCSISGEEMGGYTEKGGTYSIDYLIGDEENLSKGYGKKMVGAMEDMIRDRGDAKRIVVEPEKGNLPSRRLLLSCGYTHDEENDVFVKEMR